MLDEQVHRTCRVFSSSAVAAKPVQSGFGVATLATVQESHDSHTLVYAVQWCCEFAVESSDY